MSEVILVKRIRDNFFDPFSGRLVIRPEDA